MGDFVSYPADSLYGFRVEGPSNPSESQRLPVLRSDSNFPQNGAECRRMLSHRCRRTMVRVLPFIWLRLNRPDKGPDEWQ
jgi:hypothetical protein